MARDFDITWNSAKYAARMAVNMRRAIAKSCDVIATAAKVNLSVSGAYPGEPSAPGEPPHKQGGLLRAETQYAIDDDGLSGKVGPLDELVYGRIQELGGDTGRAVLPARPYLLPAMEQEAPRVRKFIADAARKATR